MEMNKRITHNFIAIILSMLFLSLTLTFSYAIPPQAAAIKKLEEEKQSQENIEVIIRPQVEYTENNSRDPFEPYIKEEEMEPDQPTAENMPVPPPVKPELKVPMTVQGIIWGGSIPQAIINNKVVKVGDKIEEAEITAIGKDGIEVSYNNFKYNIVSPAAAILPKEKEPKGGQNEPQP